MKKNLLSAMIVLTLLLSFAAQAGDDIPEIKSFPVPDARPSAETQPLAVSQPQAQAQAQPELQRPAAVASAPSRQSDVAKTDGQALPVPQKVTTEAKTQLVLVQTAAGYAIDKKLGYDFIGGKWQKLIGKQADKLYSGEKQAAMARISALRGDSVTAVAPVVAVPKTAPLGDDVLSAIQKEGQKTRLQSLESDAERSLGKGSWKVKGVRAVAIAPKIFFGLDMTARALLTYNAVTSEKAPDPGALPLLSRFVGSRPAFPQVLTAVSDRAGTKPGEPQQLAPLPTASEGSAANASGGSNLEQ